MLRWLSQLILSLGRPAAPGPRPRSKPKGRQRHGVLPRRNRGPTKFGKGNRKPPFRGTSAANPVRQHAIVQAPGQWSGIAYHGTPSQAHAKAIFQNGFLVGSGNALGDGVYFATDISIATGYAGNQGVLLKCHVRGRCCQWNNHVEKEYAQWCTQRRVKPDNSARTAFLLQKGYEILRNGKILVVLSPQMANQSAWQMKNRRIRILGALDAASKRTIRV